MSVRLSTTFRPDEVAAALQLMSAMERGIDAQVIARSRSYATLKEKFGKLEAKYRAQILGIPERKGKP